MTQTYIHVCTEADAEDLRAVSFQTFEEAFKEASEPNNYAVYVKKAFTPEVITAELNTPTNAFFFLKQRATNDIIGYLKLRWDRSEEFFPDIRALELQRIYIKKNYWQQGYGKILLDFAEHYAHLHAYKRIWLVVWFKNENAVRFYEREGWETFAQKDFPFGNEIHHDFVMRKLIDKASVPVVG